MVPQSLRRIPCYLSARVDAPPSGSEECDNTVVIGRLEVIIGGSLGSPAYFALKLRNQSRIGLHRPEPHWPAPSAANCHGQPASIDAPCFRKFMSMYVLFDPMHAGMYVDRSACRSSISCMCTCMASCHPRGWGRTKFCSMHRLN